MTWESTDLDTDDGMLERYIIPAAREMRRQAIQQMTDCGIWLEQAEFIMDMLFARDAPSFEEFLGTDLARAMYLNYAPRVTK